MNKALVEAWRNDVARHKVRSALIAGFVATHVATNTGMWFHGIGLPDLNFNYLNGLLVFGNSGMAATGMQDPVILTLFGAAAHYAMGISFALVFAFGVAPLIPISETLIGNFAKAIIFGLVLATLSAVWWINLFGNLAGPNTSAGIFMTNLGADWWKWLAAVYLWHIVYGFNLGAFYNPAPLAETEEATEMVREVQMAPAPAGH